MINKLKNKLKVQDNRVLMSNFFSLSALQMATYLFPLITFPYIVRTIGVELFGVLSMAMALITFFQIFTDYGFGLSATKEISIHRDNPTRLSEIFSSVLTIQFILMLISFLFLTILVFSIQKFSEDSEVYFLTFGLVIGSVLFPNWFFQGIEKMKYITILTIISKLTFTLLIFIFIKNKHDFIYIPLLNSLGTIISGILSLYIIHKNFNIKFTLQKFEVIKHHFQGGWDIFIQRMYVSLYGSINTFILGFLTNNTILGYYSIATRVIDMLNQIFGIISKAYYPYFSKKFVNNPKQSFMNLKKVSLSLLMFSAITMIIVLLLDDKIVKLIAGSNYNIRITETLTILSYGIILIPFFSLFTAALVSIGESKALQIVARDSAIISLVLVFPLIFLFQEKGLAYLRVFLWVFIIMKYYLIIRQSNQENNILGQNNVT
jgi:PST family polysaccharide transporter